MSRRILFVWTTFATLALSGIGSPFYRHHVVSLATFELAHCALFGIAAFLVVRQNGRLWSTTAIVWAAATFALLVNLAVGWRRRHFPPSVSPLAGAVIALAVMAVLALVGALAGGGLALLTRRRPAELPPT